jgi:hypothetical protein
MERSFAHLYETGGMRRVHLRGKTNLAERLLIHAAAFNLSLLFAGDAAGGHGRAGGGVAPTGDYRNLWYLPLKAQRLAANKAGVVVLRKQAMMPILPISFGPPLSLSSEGPTAGVLRNPNRTMPQ